VALLELSFSDPKKLKKEGRAFDCATCPIRVQEIRRCKEDKEFTHEDGPLWPMFIYKEGEPYGFCPGKATWDSRAVEYFHHLVLIAHLKILPQAGGLNAQDSELIHDLAWFLRQYDMMDFMRKAEAIFGGGDSANSSQPKPNKRTQK